MLWFVRVRAKTPLRIRKRVGHAGGAWLVAGHAESLRLCGAMLGACVGMSARHPRMDGGRMGATERWVGGTPQTLERSTGAKIGGCLLEVAQRQVTRKKTPANLHR